MVNGGRGGRSRDNGDPLQLTSLCDLRFLMGMGMGVLCMSLVGFFLEQSSSTSVFHSVISNALSATTNTTVTAASEDQNNQTAAAAATKDARLLHYFHNYRYFPPASRYDYNLHPAKECGASPQFDSFFSLPSNVRSRLGEDKFIYETFFQSHQPNLTGDTTLTGGTYIELGAFDGSQESNSHFFDKCLGWKGLLIEGNPDSYQKVVSNRPFAHKMSLAPSCSAEYERVNKTVPFYRYPITNVGLVGHARTYEGKPTVDVPCGPLTPILADIFAGHSSINFFSLDVEGAEQLVLATIDFPKVPRIDVLMIEIQNNHCHDDKCAVRVAVRETMKQQGYQRYEKLVHASDIYVHPLSQYQIPESVAHPVG